MKKFRQIFLLLILVNLTMGFRFFPDGNNWNIDSSTPARSKLFVIYPDATRALENDLPAGDSLAGISTTLTVKQLMDAIIADYNNIQASFLVLADNTDADYAANSTNRTITIEVGSTKALAAGGEAKQSTNDNQVTACTITLKDSTFDSAKEFTETVTHELGHCVGLDHPQDTVHAIMSYFRDSDDVYRLAIDDKMGITYLYPVYPDKADEDPTMGFSCSHR